MNRRTVLGAALAASLALTVVGCGSQTGADNDNELTLAGWSLSSTPEFQTLADGFNADEPEDQGRAQGIRRDQLRHPDGRGPGRRHRTGPLSDQEPQRASTPTLRGGQLADVSDVAAELGSTRHRGEHAGRQDVRDPYRQDAMILYYNKDLFKKASVPTPDGSWTWDTTPKVAAKLSTKLKADGVEAKGAYQHGWQSPCRASPPPRLPARRSCRRRLRLPEALLRAGAGPAGIGRDGGLRHDHHQQAQLPVAVRQPEGRDDADGHLVRRHALTQQKSGDAETFGWGIAPGAAARRLDHRRATTPR